LQAYAQGEHGNQGGDADGYAEGGEGIAQDGFAEIAGGEFGEVAEFHDFVSG